MNLKDIKEIKAEIELQVRKEHTSYCETDKNGQTSFYMKFGNHRFFVATTPDAVEWQLQKLIKSKLDTLYIEA